MRAHCPIKVAYDLKSKLFYKIYHVRLYANENPICAILIVQKCIYMVCKSAQTYEAEHIVYVRIS